MSHYAALSSLCGCLASIAGKHAFDTARLTRIADHLCTPLSSSPLTSLTSPLTLPQCGTLALPLLRLACIGCVLLLNSVMLTSLVRCMHAKGTVHATTVSSALSFVLSGIAGVLLFEEAVNAQWLLGIAVVLAGVFLIQRGSAELDVGKQQPGTAAAAEAKRRT